MRKTAKIEEIVPKNSKTVEDLRNFLVDHYHNDEVLVLDFDEMVDRLITAVRREYAKGKTG
jgi:hypothetical protein